MRILTSLTTGLLTSVFWIQYAAAQVYGGGGIQEGLDQAGDITDISNETDLVELIKNGIEYVLVFVTILAVAAIIIGGLYLITSNGEEEQKEKAKKILLYVILGLLLIILSLVIVKAIIGFTDVTVGSGSGDISGGGSAFGPI